jgi:hypothetical protein
MPQPNITCEIPNADAPLVLVGVAAVPVVEPVLAPDVPDAGGTAAPEAPLPAVPVAIGLSELIPVAAPVAAAFFASNGAGGDDTCKSREELQRNACCPEFRKGRSRKV